MTTLSKNSIRCSICGTVSEHECLMSSNSYEGPDLDFRPAPMYRDTMDLWIQECPNCGYVAESIDEKLESSPKFLRSEKYIRTDGIDFRAGLAERFYRDYLLMLEEKEHGCAFFSALHAAWACDDEDDEKTPFCAEKSLGAVA